MRLSRRAVENDHRGEVSLSVFSRPGPEPIIKGEGRECSPPDLVMRVAQCHVEVRHDSVFPIGR